MRSAASAAWAASAGNARRVPDTSSSAARAASVFAEQARRHHAGKHAVARGLRTGQVAVGSPALGQLRQRDQQGGLRDGQALRLLAEVSERCGAHAFEIAAIGCAASGSARGFPAWRAAARSGRRGKSGGVSGQNCGFRAARSGGRAASTASSRRTRCGHCRRTVSRRGQAPGGRRPNGRRNACPHRRPAFPEIADRSGRVWWRAASARRVVA